jgi:hypothetical protein
MKLLNGYWSALNSELSFDRITVRLGKGLKPGVTFERLWGELEIY